MSQSTYSHPNQSGAAYRAAINGAQQAINSGNSGATAPSETYPFMTWVDTAASPALVKQRDAANSTWVTIAAIDGSGRRPYYNGAVVGTAATKAHGTAIGNLPALVDVGGGTAGLPAVNGSLLTGLPGAGRRVIVEEKVALNDASLTFSTGIGSTYDDYAFVFDSVLPATDGDSLYMRVNGDSGASAYRWGMTGFIAGVSAISQADVADSKIALCPIGGGAGIGTAAGESGLDGQIDFSSPDVAKIHQFSGVNRWINAGTPSQAVALIGASWLTAAAITSVTFLMSSGNIASGAIRLVAFVK